MIKLCDFRAGENSPRCQYLAELTIEVPDRTEPLKGFCPDHFETVVWTLKRCKEEFTTDETIIPSNRRPAH